MNVASISGLAADYGLPAYCAAKAAVINYTRALALDHAAAGIRANVVCPGLIDTPMTGFVDRLGARSEWTRSIPAAPRRHLRRDRRGRRFRRLRRSQLP